MQSFSRKGNCPHKEKYYGGVALRHRVLDQMGFLLQSSFFFASLPNATLLFVFDDVKKPGVFFKLLFMQRNTKIKFYYWSPGKR